MVDRTVNLLKFGDVTKDRWFISVASYGPAGLLGSSRAVKGQQERRMYW